MDAKGVAGDSKKVPLAKALLGMVPFVCAICRVRSTVRFAILQKKVHPVRFVEPHWMYFYTFDGAEERTRTSTREPALDPEPSVSTNSTTSAHSTDNFTTCFLTRSLYTSEE